MKITVHIGRAWIYRMRRVLAIACLALLSACIGYKVVFGANGMKMWQAKRAESQRLQQQIDQMQADQSALRRRVDGLQRGEPSLIEKEAREQLGYVKPGEVVLFQPKTVRTPALASNSAPR